MAAAGGVQGIDAFQSSLDQAAREVAGLLDAHREAGHLVQDRAETIAPRRTGRLAAGHQTVVVAGQMQVINPTDYAGVVHARKPWLAKSLHDLQQQLLDIYADAIARAVAQIHGK